MATYDDIEAYVQTTYGRSVKDCWIAHVRELNGLPVRRAWNRKPGPGRQNPCPDWARRMIEDAMKHFRMIR